MSETFPRSSIVRLHRPKLLHVSVQESLKAYIADNRLASGTPLPPEGELAAQLGVSRGSVREAIRALESLGIVESLTSTFYGPSWTPAVGFGFLLLTLAIRPAGIFGR